MDAHISARWLAHAAPVREAEPILADLAQAGLKREDLPPPVEVTVCGLPFYRRYQLVRAEANAPFGPAFLALRRPGRALLIDGSGRPLAIANQDDPLVLSPATAIAYARFALALLSGVRPPVVVIETREDLPWAIAERPQPPEDPRAVAEANIRPLTVVPGDTGPDLEISGSFMVGGEFYVGTIRVHADGTIEPGTARFSVTGLPDAGNFVLS